MTRGRPQLYHVGQVWTTETQEREITGVEKDTIRFSEKAMPDREMYKTSFRKWIIMNDAHIKGSKKTVDKTIFRKTSSLSYISWSSMLQRCNNKNHTSYKNYGGRGISVCDRWLKFENFYEDMGERKKGVTLDRIDNNGNYEPENCRWATYLQQGNNTRRTKDVECRGKSQSLSQWARELGLSRSCLSARIARGMSIEEALSPKRKKK